MACRATGAGECWSSRRRKPSNGSPAGGRTPRTSTKSDDCDRGRADRRGPESGSPLEQLPVDRLDRLEGLVPHVEQTVAGGVDQVVGLADGRRDPDHVDAPAGNVFLDRAIVLLANHDFGRQLIVRIRDLRRQRFPDRRGRRCVDRRRRLLRPRVDDDEQAGGDAGETGQCPADQVLLAKVWSAHCALPFGPLVPVSSSIRILADRAVTSNPRAYHDPRDRSIPASPWTKAGPRFLPQMNADERRWMASRSPDSSRLAGSVRRLRAGRRSACVRQRRELIAVSYLPAFICGRFRPLAQRSTRLRFPDMASNEHETLYLVDGSSYLYRAFHALPSLTAADGQPTGAIFGVANMVRRLIHERAPARLAVIFDAPGRNFRHEIDPDYKANRPPMPDDLRRQIEPLHEVIDAMGVERVIVDGVEADDVIATLVRRAREAGVPVLISSGDKDLAQLVGDDVVLEDTMQDKRYDPAAVETKFGVGPDRVGDLLALTGDASDNI